MEGMHGDVRTAFLLTLFAGLSTGLGSFVVLLSRKPSLRLLSFGLGFSGGVMVFISLAELLPEAQRTMRQMSGHTYGSWFAYACFFGGIVFSWAIDSLLPDPQKNPHEVVPVASLERVGVASKEGSGHNGISEHQAKSLARVGLMTTLAIAVHNFPEGMATLVSAMADTSIGLSVAVAVAVHNIPEGMSVAVLVFFATQSRRKAVINSLASGLAEPLGAGALYLLLAPFINRTVVASMLAAVAGIMVFISFDELLPTAREYGKGHDVIAGIVSGMAVMAVSLALF